VDRYFIDACSQLTFGFMSAKAPCGLEAVPTAKSDKRARLLAHQAAFNFILPNILENRRVLVEDAPRGQTVASLEPSVLDLFREPRGIAVPASKDCAMCFVSAPDMRCFASSGRHPFRGSRGILFAGLALDADRRERPLKNK
jgi:hypothetical protein